MDSNVITRVDLLNIFQTVSCISVKTVSTENLNILSCDDSCIESYVYLYIHTLAHIL